MKPKIKFVGIFRLLLTKVIYFACTLFQCTKNWACYSYQYLDTVFRNMAKDKRMCSYLSHQYKCPHSNRDYWNIRQTLQHKKCMNLKSNYRHKSSTCILFIFYTITGKHWDRINCVNKSEKQTLHMSRSLMANVSPFGLHQFIQDQKYLE